MNSNSTTGRVFSGQSSTAIEIGRTGGTNKNISLFGPVTASGNISSSGTVTANSFTGTFAGAFSGSGQVDHDSTTNFVANEHIDHSGVSITAGDGLTGGGTIASTRTINVVGGDGITANANDIAITAAQTTITSVYNTSLAIGRASNDTTINFGTDDTRAKVMAQIDWSKKGNFTVGESSDNGVQWVFITN